MCRPWPRVPGSAGGVPADGCRTRARPNGALSRSCLAHRTCHFGFADMMPDGRADLAEQFVTDHFVPYVDGRRIPFGIGATVALDNDAVQSQKNAAVGFARIHLVAQHAERRP